jgi:hypothetical protein
VTTGVLTSDGTGAGPGSSSQCSRSTNAPSSPRTALRQATGKETSSSARTNVQRSAHSSNGAPESSGSYTFPKRDGNTLHDVLTTRMADLPVSLMRSITWDQGTEMARHLTITQTLGAPVYFCDSRSPWQRGSNENTNGLLRDYFPKGTDLGTHTPEHLMAVENQLNHRPRRVLGDRTPADLFTALLTSERPSVLRC